MVLTSCCLLLHRQFCSRRHLAVCKLIVTSNVRAKTEIPIVFMRLKIHTFEIVTLREFGLIPSPHQNPSNHFPKRCGGMVMGRIQLKRSFENVKENNGVLPPVFQLEKKKRKKENLGKMQKHLFNIAHISFNNKNQ